MDTTIFLKSKSVLVTPINGGSRLLLLFCLRIITALGSVLKV